MEKPNKNLHEPCCLTPLEFKNHALIRACIRSVLYNLKRDVANLRVCLNTWDHPCWWGRESAEAQESLTNAQQQILTSINRMKLLQGNGTESWIRVKRGKPDDYFWVTIKDPTSLNLLRVWLKEECKRQYDFDISATRMHEYESLASGCEYPHIYDHDEGWRYTPALFDELALKHHEQVWSIDDTSKWEKPAEPMPPAMTLRDLPGDEPDDDEQKYKIVAPAAPASEELPAGWANFATMTGPPGLGPPAATAGCNSLYNYPHQHRRSSLQKKG